MMQYFLLFVVIKTTNIHIKMTQYNINTSNKFSSMSFRILILPWEERSDFMHIDAIFFINNINIFMIVFYIADDWQTI